MSASLKPGQLMLDLAGPSITATEREILQHPFVGGVILFTRNYENKQQLAQLIKDIRAVRNPILITVDQEGGRVQRFKNEFVELAPLRALGDQYDQNRTSAAKSAQAHAEQMAGELKALDVDLSFTPVLDIDYGLSEVIGSRSFHKTPDAIIDLADQYIIAMHKAAMPATGKHFPGHGGVTVDSHLDLPVDERDLNTLFDTDIKPFQQLVNKLDAIMAAHIVFPAVDDMPVGFSHKWLTDILRHQIGFEGVIFSDCLSMKATEQYGDYPQRAKLALDAGCDMVLVCNNPEGAIRVLDNNTDTKLNLASVQRLEKLLTL